MTKIYGIIGYPIKHSLSPKMHNAAFRHLGIDAEYRLFEVRPGELGGFFKRRFFEEKFSGINITIPHKEASLKYMHSLVPPVNEIGAVNTVVLENDKLIGYNTDVIGFVGSLKEDLSFEPFSKKAVIFGAGGAARAISFGLNSLKIKRIILVDIDKNKAAALAGDLEKAGCEAIALKKDEMAIKEIVLDSDLLVNATPCGMKENDAELLNPDFLHKGLTVFDLVYNPPQTHLVREAKKRGLKAANGIGMLLSQGAASFELWTGRKAPVEVMRKALEKME